MNKFCMKKPPPKRLFRRLESLGFQTLKGKNLFLDYLRLRLINLVNSLPKALVCLAVLDGLYGSY